MDQDIAKLRSLIAQRAHTEVFDDNEPLENIGITSLNVMQLVANIEDHFDVEVPEEDLVPENFATLIAIAALVSRLKQQDF